MLLPTTSSLGAGMRYSRLSGTRPGGASTIKTISIPVANAPAPAPAVMTSKLAIEEEGPEAEDSIQPAGAVKEESADAAAQAEAARKERLREKRKRKNAAKKAAAASQAADAGPDAQDAADEALSASVVTIESAPEAVSAAPSSPVLGGANLTDSGTASSDEKASGVSTPASSHGFAAPQRTLDWASLDNAEEIPAPVFEDGRKSVASDRPEAVTRTSQTSDPSYTPRVGRFWSHDERLLEGDLRMSPRWRGRSSPAPGDRASSPFAGSSDGGWQEVTKHQPKPTRMTEKPKVKLAAPSGPKSSWGKGNYASPGMRAWANEDEESARAKPTSSSLSPPVNAPTPAELANRPPEPPWTARSPVPYLFNSGGSRTFVDDITRKRTVTLRVHLRSERARGPTRTTERTFTSVYRLPPQAHPHPLLAVIEPVTVCLQHGRTVEVSHPSAEREKRAREHSALAAQAAAQEAELQRQHFESERRAQLEVQERAALEAAELDRAKADEARRRMEAAQATLAAAMPKPIEEEVEGPVASTSSLAQPVPLPPSGAQQPPIPLDVASSPAQDGQPPFMGIPPPGLQHAGMFPPGPFTFAEGMGPPGLHIFDVNLGMVVPIDPSQLYPPGPPMPGMDGGPPSPADFYQPAPAPQPSFFAPARSSKIEIRAPTPGQPVARSQRRHPAAASSSAAAARNASHSPSASRYDASTPVEPVEEHMIPGSFAAGGAVYFNHPPAPGYFFPPPGAPAEFYGAPMHPGDVRSPDMMDPAILSLGQSTPAPQSVAA